MKSLQSITDAWGKWRAKKNGTKCSFTASTNYKKEDELDKYHDHQVESIPQPIVYNSSYQPKEEADTVYEMWFDNASSADQQQTFTKESSSTESFTWSITEAVSIGVEVSASAGVEGVATTSATLSTQLTLSSTQEKTASETQSWSVNSVINVPANSSVKCDMIVDVAQFNTDFVAPVLLKGDVAIWYDDKVNGHYLWFVNIKKVFQEVQDNDLADISGYEIADHGVLANAQGTLVGKEGIQVSVAATQYPLRTSTPPEKFKAVSSYQIVP